MSFSHELRVLNLDSQTELLNRLKLLTNFGSNIVVAHGESGSGRSWLAHRYLEAWMTDKDQALLACHTSQDDAQRRSTILNQVALGVPFNSQDSLVDSLERLLGEESCNLVIVIDDADLLSDLMLSELALVARLAKERTLWSINIVLFCSTGSIEETLQALCHPYDVNLVPLEIERLRTEEAEEFVDALVLRYTAGEEAKKQVRKAFKKAPATPGALMGLGELKVEKMIIIRSIVASPKKIAVLVVSLILLIAGGYWWLLSKPVPEPVQEVSPTIEQTAIPTLPEATVHQDDIPKRSVTDEALNQESGNEGESISDDGVALPPEVVTETTTLESQVESDKRVIVSSDVVDALMSDSSKEGQVKLTVEEPEELEESKELDGNTTTSDTPNDALPGEDSVVEPVDNAENTSSVTFATQELLDLEATQYTLQLAAITSLEEVEAFIDVHQLQGKVRVYPTLRSERQWYIITYQEFDNIQSARDAISELSKELRFVSPWAKSLSQVHREINRLPK